MKSGFTKFLLVLAVWVLTSRAEAQIATNPPGNELRSIIITVSPDPESERTRIQNSGMIETHSHEIRVGPETELDLLRDEEFREKMKEFWGKPTSRDLAFAIGNVILTHYISNGRPLVEVNAPGQESMGYGVLQFYVLEGKLGKPVTVEGNKWFSKKVYLRPINLKEGEVINQNELLDDIDWLNRSPYRSVGVKYSPGDAYGETDVTLVASDTRPFTGTIGYENYHVEELGEHRVYAGVNWGNVFGLDHRAVYRYTTDTSFERLHAHYASYEIPIHALESSFRVFGGYATVEPEIRSSVGDISFEGKGWQVSPRLDIPLSSIKKYRHQLSGGFDFKRSEGLFSILVPAFNESAETHFDVAQFTLEYSGAMPDRIGTNVFRIGGFYSPGGLTKYNEEEYFTVRPGGEAEDNYWYTRGTLERTFNLVKYHESYSLLMLRSTGQLAGDRLVPSEQLFIGGAGSVRGYREFLLPGDHAFIGNAELYSPAFRIVRRSTKGWDEGLRLLGFLDYGAAFTKDPRGEEPSSLDMMSVGVGLRYNASRYFAVQFDYGWQVMEPKQPNGVDYDPEDSRAHIAASITF